MYSMWVVFAAALLFPFYFAKINLIFVSAVIFLLLPLPPPYPLRIVTDVTQIRNVTTQIRYLS